MTAIGAKLCDIYIHLTHTYIYTYLSFSLYLSSYLSLRSDINCLLPNLIRNFRRRDNLTSFLFSLTRSPSLLYRGLVPRIFLSTSEWANERASECNRARPCPSLPIQFISLRSTHVYSMSPPSRLPSLADGRGEKKCAKLTDEEQRWRERVSARVGHSSFGRFVLNSSRKESVEFTLRYEKRKIFHYH